MVCQIWEASNEEWYKYISYISLCSLKWGWYRQKQLIHCESNPIREKMVTSQVRILFIYLVISNLDEYNWALMVVLIYEYRYIPELKDRMKVDKILRFDTKKILKLGFNLDVK